VACLLFLVVLAGILLVVRYVVRHWDQLRLETCAVLFAGVAFALLLIWPSGFDGGGPNPETSAWTVRWPARHPEWNGPSENVIYHRLGYAALGWPWAWLYSMNDGRGAADLTALGGDVALGAMILVAVAVLAGCAALANRHRRAPPKNKGSPNLPPIPADQGDAPPGG
jgi:hypothetical protein